MDVVFVLVVEVEFLSTFPVIDLFVHLDCQVVQSDPVFSSDHDILLVKNPSQEFQTRSLQFLKNVQEWRHQCLVSVQKLQYWWIQNQDLLEQEADLLD